ncbi:hypothetical protein ACB087_01255 [Vibrio sp. VNB-15]
MNIAALFKQHVMQPVLDHLDAVNGGTGSLNTPAAMNLILMIIAHESGKLTYAKQVRGPALGFTQMEPATFRWLIKWLGDHRPHLLEASKGFVPEPSPEHMIFNPQYAVCMARLNLLRFPEPLPPANDLRALAAYAKKYWNTHAGKATDMDYLNAYLQMMEARQ